MAWKAFQTNLPICKSKWSTPYINSKATEEETKTPLKVSKLFEVPMLGMDEHNEDTNWYFDSGATKHMTGDPNSIQNLWAVENSNIKLARGHCCHQILGKWDVAFKYNDEIKKISNILYILGVTKNLLYVGSIADKGCVVTFESNESLIVMPIFHLTMF